jgi:hypothetical protein
MIKRGVSLNAELTHRWKSWIWSMAGEPDREKSHASLSRRKREITQAVSPDPARQLD